MKFHLISYNNCNASIFRGLSTSFLHIVGKVWYIN